MKYIYLDESGDLGFRQGKASSKYFVITCLAVDDKHQMEKVIKKVHKSLRKSVKKLSGGVLHCFHERPEVRRKMLTLLSQLDCHIMTIYVNKTRVYTRLQDEKHLLYNYFANILIDRIMRNRKFVKSDQVTLIAEKRETNRFLNANFKTYLESQAKSKHQVSLSVEIKTSSQEKNLQATDFVSWAIFRKYERDDASYYNIIRAKVIEEKSLYG